MSTLLTPPDAASAASELFIMRDVSWETYEQLLLNYVDSAGPRFAYDRGVLEIMRPSSEHEELTEIITQLVYILAEEWNLEYRNFGRTTFRLRKMESGFEPDSCFYIQSLDRIGDVRHLDPAIHPPPDLVIEVDMTSRSLKKFPIYARMNVAEVWRYTGKEVAIFLLKDGSDSEAQASAAIPRLDSSTLSDLVGQSAKLKRSAWIRTVREWARAR